MKGIDYRLNFNSIVKNWLTRLGLLLLALTNVQCNKNQSSSSSTTEPVLADTLLQAGPLAPISVEYAKNFSVANYEGYKVAHLHFHSEDRDLQFDQKIVLVQRGTAPPQLMGDLSNAWLVEVPLRAAAANDDGEITRLKTLNLTDNIVAMGGGGIYDSELRERWEAKQIASIGYSFHSPPQPEVVLTLQPDVLFLYAFNQKSLDSAGKLQQLGINAIPHFAWAEPSFLGKAEWIKFSSLFFNREAAANEIFQRVVDRCQELMQMARSQTEEKEAFLVYHPSGKSDWSAHRNDFYASFIEAIGVENVLKDDGPTHEVGMNNEKLLSLAKDADVWIANSTSDKDWPTANYLRSFKAYQNGDVYHYQKRTRHEHDAYDWYETPEVRPDLVLADLVAIFYPSLLPDHELLYFEKVQLTKL